ncbi:MAG TPA: bifunctional glutamate N-acetyltransferase/amino-acid acetyltransferase ArgJ [Terriglobia bacterium]|nr:bifunctional glutamate N-acetyltransferase/amino-acid acetyltransferase ArgJ [Terriglobia bacterium]
MGRDLEAQTFSKMSAWEKIDGHLGTPAGFRGAAVASGLKKVKGALDLALLFSDVPATSAAGVFTTNLAAAEPVKISRLHLKSSRGLARAIVVNSGNANACTGALGKKAALETTRAVARLMGIPTQQVLVASTGVIGVPLKLERITRQLPALRASLTHQNASGIARAIMTTDTFPKCCAVRSRIDGRTVHIAGVAKGAGMIHPRMATMLSFLTTDARVRPNTLARLLRQAVEVSFNRVSVDGDTSTNDTVLVLANGASGANLRPGTRDAAHFLAGLVELCQKLAKMIARDGEGARKLVTVEISGARNDRDAERIARAIVNSPLVKTAIAGADPNWGRIICAAGYSGAKFDPSMVDIRVNDFYLCRRGLDAAFDEAAAKRELDRKELTLRVDLRQGKGSALMWTCDLTHDYITINASYRT